MTTSEHGYTHHPLHKELTLDLEVVSYDQVLKRSSPHRATYIFTDLDRLSAWRLHDAALLYRQLKGSGIKVLNDPARVLGRFGLLRSLNRAEINGFDCYRVEELARPQRWPVFLRLEGNHAAPVSDLLHNEQELEQAIERVVSEGAPRAALLIIEYAAEPVRPGLFRKLSVFRVGERLLGYTCVHEDRWLVKYGQAGIAPDDLYQEEYEIVRDNPYGDALLPAFEKSGIEYGRVDFGLVGGRPQIYEINSNPSVDLGSRRRFDSLRDRSKGLFRTSYLEAMEEIDTFPRPMWRSAPSTLMRTARFAPQRIRARISSSKAKRLKQSVKVGATAVSE